jgi:hypothetical protein
MPRPIKYSPTTTSGSYQKGNVAIGTNPIAYDSTWVNSPVISNGTFVVTEVGAVGVPKFYSPTNDNEWIRLAKQEGATGANTGSVNAVKSWFASQANYDVANIDLPLGMPNIVGNGLVLNLDAGINESYPGSGTTWTDLSGIGNNGTLINGPTFDSANSGSIVFDGVNDFIQIPYSSYWDSNVFGTATNFTIECWYKPDLFKNWDTIIEKSSNSGYYSESEGPAIWTNAGSIQGVFSSGVTGNPGGSYVIISYSTTTLKWYHITFTGDGTTLRLYVDGVQRATGAISSRTVAVSNGNVGPRFGARAAMNGKLGVARFYTKALSADEVLQNFNAQRSRFGI